MPMETDDRGHTSESGSMLQFFGGRLRKVRKDMGWSQEVTALKAHSTNAMISYIENAKRIPTEQLAQDLDVAFETDLFSEMHSLVLEYVYPDWFRPYAELECQATAIRIFDSQLVSGLLQTEAYARSVLAARRPAQLDDLVAARMTRQQVLERENPPRLWVVLDEMALMRHIGGRDVMREQLHRLLDAARNPLCVVQIIPRQVAAHPGIEGPFTLLSFDGGGDVLYVDGFSQGRAALSREEVVDARHAYDLLLGLAASPDSSAELIRAHIEEIEQ
ncbi:helix-turn-helix domain-containing protein [Streptomyces zagrosensis]|uniref:Transcriptional regulator with XRE-family HTH domain n=1 Tax=Streptomyces zagrosensis TaxID=1042984 RepID=A0A7W9UXU0_9ACTN|nr:helix-turn-helix transcriptional regulator [Streptomyces zagrosensis]MBB5935235.1 transcriptional regulator with XRE-family HTH domain [Streptomyces zagrosensis]